MTLREVIANCNDLHGGSCCGSLAPGRACGCPSPREPQDSTGPALATPTNRIGPPCTNGYLVDRGGVLETFRAAASSVRFGHPPAPMLTQSCHVRRRRPHLPSQECAGRLIPNSTA